jgi:ubiquinone/menaquinone biosynthesis C-methylase UbiE
MPEKDNVRKQWNNLADYWISQVRDREQLWRDFLNAPVFKKMVGDVQGLRLLDMACGEGYFSRFYAKAGADVTGIDISENQIAGAQEEESRTPLGIQYQVADASIMNNIESESFDIVISFMALMDIENYEGAIMQASRVLKPGGRFVFILIHPCFGWSRRGFDGETLCRWEYRSLEDGSREPHYLKIFEYFTNHSYKMRWKDDEGHEVAVTTMFHRTLTDYMKTLRKNGFVVSQIEEPRPVDGKLEPNDLVKLFKIPHTICVEALKLNSTCVCGG